MTRVFAFILVLSSICLAAPTKTGICDVKKVFAGKRSTYISLVNCSDTLGFTNKNFDLSHHRSLFIYESSDGYDERVRFDNVGDVLGMKQTSELAYLFQRKLRVEVSNSNELLFLSLADPINLSAPTGDDSSSSSSTTSDTTSFPPPSDDGFRPVPSPRKGF